MKNILKENIEQLIIDYLIGDITDEDRVLLERLISEDEEVKELYQQSRESFLGAKAALFLKQVDQHAAWDKLSKTITPSLEVKTAKTIHFKKWLVAASILLPLAMVSIFIARNYFSNKQQPQLTYKNEKVKLFLASGESIALDRTAKNKTVNTNMAVLHNEQGTLQYELKDQKDALSYNTLVVPRTKDYKIKLSDGTEVWLNSDSELRFPLEFNADQRVVYLKGEAFFKVTKNPKKPFIVKVNESLDVQVLGTSFNVNSYASNALKVALVEGSVKLNSKGEESLLKPGFMATYSPAGGFSQSTFDDQLVLSWMRGIYFFNNANLNEINEIVQRWYDVKIMAEPGADISISGAIEKDKPLEEFLQNLSATSQLKYKVKENNIIILNK
ncbi:FecR domain-containing protein [Solitalea sp. MAHUQ-68]|uniref:FecR domain-containing protein n=1 Tax=Solitalea agri TaxID=2953739 RepID=A0A9X2JGM1_9SPHI|nr:FecR domain-containing protein [Solitalea agri]MCO4294566.1 FecR domain-containing protein [Solitalea agri]